MVKPKSLFKFALGVFAVLVLLMLPLRCWPEKERALQFRGVWVNAWGRGFKSPDEIDKLVETAASAGLNALLVQVRKRADAYYNSSIEPRASEIPEGFDPLAELIPKAHRLGLEVHAWLVVYPAATGAEKSLPDGHILRQHPEWLTRDADGNAMRRGDGEGLFLDPGLPEVQDYIVSVAVELASRYDVDGIHLDYIRYPSRRWGYHPESVRRFTEETGCTPGENPVAWDNWRRQQVTLLVARLKREITKVRPGVKLSAAVFADQSDAFKNRLQDWQTWLQHGWVDFVVPMNYVSNRSLFASRSRQAYSRSRNVYMGVGVWNKPSDVAVSQLEFLKSMGVPGFVIYHYAAADEAFWKALKAKVFAHGG
jgi:uncharacterized lipoprotein YddW (UPF0748 family)